jgi:hypothetical protein
MEALIIQKPNWRCFHHHTQIHEQGHFSGAESTHPQQTRTKIFFACAINNKDNQINPSKQGLNVFFQTGLEKF